MSNTPTMPKPTRPAVATIATIQRETRLSAKLTQEEVARRLGRRQGFVATYESGQRRFDLIELDTICEALGVDLVVLLRRWRKGGR